MLFMSGLRANEGFPRAVGFYAFVRLLLVFVVIPLRCKTRADEVLRHLWIDADCISLRVLNS